MRRELPATPGRWLLHRADAHRVYERVGFGRPSPWAMERER